MSGFSKSMKLMRDLNVLKRLRHSKTNGEGKKLFTPGPLGTSPAVKAAMLRDLGSRDIEFVQIVKNLRSKLLDIAGVPQSEYTCVPLQGSGSFAVESVFQTAVPRRNGKVLVLENGAYGKRKGKICEVIGIPCRVESFPENEHISVERVKDVLKKDNAYSLVSAVHCETSSGVINPVPEIGKVIKDHSPGTDFFVDAMSSFGAVPIDLLESGIDYFVSSANKCLEGVPGFSYVIAKLDRLKTCEGNSRSLCLDIYDQYMYLESSGQFRFTPPTHTMLAFDRALQEFEEEGGVTGRALRYKQNREIIRQGMHKLGFQEFLSDEHDGYIITSYKFPKDPEFNFKDFYERLNDKGQVIYPGKVLDADCFRIGNIGYLFPEDMEHLLVCIEEVCEDMGITLPIKN